MKAMMLLNWIVSVLIIVFGIYIIIMNWCVFLNNHIHGNRWTSAVPFVGAVSLALGVVLLPVPQGWKYAWIPLFLDWGSIPVVATAIISWLRRK